MGTSSQGTRSHTDATVRIGAALVAVGMMATIATLVPLFLDISPLPVWAYLLCFLAPLGLGVILVALWQRARTRSARLRSERQSHS